MTRAATLRQIDITRAIRAARAAGLCIVGIRPNGYVETAEPRSVTLDNLPDARKRPEGLASPDDVLAELRGWAK
jgi:hypothetical protein